VTATYPPDRHLLRDLRFSFDESADGTRHAFIPVVPEICGDDGSVRAGALATLVDVVGGGLAASTARPDWIATADLTLHLFAGARAGEVEAAARVLRAGRTTVVIEVGLRGNPLHGHARDVGIATMSFSVLPRRDSNPEVDEMRPVARSTMAVDGSGLAVPLLDALGAVVVDERGGRLEVPVTDWARNSMGAMQGGVVAMIAEAAGEAALRHAAAAPLVVADLQITYLSFGRVGPIETAVEVLACDAHSDGASIEVVDAGADHRRMALARVGATRRLP
jgi:uncharacterized protein (TIGR00369 family)